MKHVVTCNIQMKEDVMGWAWVHKQEINTEF
jgi:hypothetical protein